MNYIVQFANDPNSFTEEQKEELKTELKNAVQRKISNLENKYKIKLKFPKGMCNTKDNDKLPLPIIETPIFTNNSILYVPFDIIIGDSSDENYVDKLSSCMRIVNSIKRNLEKYEEGEISKEQVDTQFFDWKIEEDSEKTKPKVYVSEIDEMYDKKFGNDTLIKQLIEKLETMYS